MIDVAAIGALLAPALPYLLKSADHAATQAATAIGEKGLEYAQRLWDMLAVRLGDRPGAREAAEEVAADPADGDARRVLEYHVRKLLERDAGLAAEVEALMAQAAQHVEIRVTGDRNVILHDSEVKGSTIITGDGDTAAGG